MRKFIQLLFVLLPLAVFGNVAQPGIWGSGGMGNYTLLFPEDSSGFGKVQMVRESIAIQLYPGYAAVYGRYWMHNTSDDTISMSVGYPINSYFDAQNNNNMLSVQFDSIFGLMPLQDGQPLMLQPMHTNGAETKNWITWRNTFAPHDTSRVEVYFLVNTNDASISKGYNKDHYNGFTYLLETGSVWKQPIVNGEILIEMMPPLHLGDVEGLMPKDGWRVIQGRQILYRTFKDLSPTYNDNIVLTYGGRQKEFDFTKVVENRGALFNNLPVLALTVRENTQFKDISYDDPFKVDSKQADTMAGLMGALMLVALVVLLGVPLIIAVRYFKKKRK